MYDKEENDSAQSKLEKQERLEQKRAHLNSSLFGTFGHLPLSSPTKMDQRLNSQILHISCLYLSYFSRQ